MIKSKGIKTYLYDSSGVTLVELIVVVSIIGILGLAGITSMSRRLPDYRLKAAVRELAGTIQSARVNAIRSNHPWSVVFNVEQERYFLCSDEGAADSCADAASLQKEVNLDNYGKSGDIVFGWGAATKKATSSGGAFSSGGEISYNGDRLIFNPGGMPPASLFGGYVYLQNTLDNSMALGTVVTGGLHLKTWRTNDWVAKNE